MTTPPEELPRDELEAEIADLRERVERLEQLIDVPTADGPDDAGLEDVFLAEIPVGKMVQNTKRDRKALQRYLFGDMYGGAEGIEEHIKHHGTLQDEFSGTPNEDVSDEANRARRLATRLSSPSSTPRTTRSTFSTRRRKASSGIRAPRTARSRSSTTIARRRSSSKRRVAAPHQAVVVAA